jgi:aerobic carbon-monoxide dehydrogenase small subunit
MKVSLTINGTKRNFDVQSNAILAELLREDCALTGTKIGCDQGVCGACTVLVDDVPTAACSTFAFAVDGQSIQTIEGLSEGIGNSAKLHPVQEAFKSKSAFQCGYCTPGMILLTKALLDQNPSPTRQEIVEWLGANICRCTGYGLIIEAAEEAARLTQEASQ